MRNNQITQGVIWKQLLIFFFPVLFGTFFQQIYNTADSVIVGRFVGTEALAAVGGSVNQIVNFLVEIFVGLTAGAGVIVAQFYGASDKKNLGKTIYTSYSFAITAGIVISVIGFLAAEFLLVFMKTPKELMAYSSTYLHVYFCGTVFNLTYNMGASILRALGDSRRPLYVLIIACVLNICLDLIFVVAADMGVFGAALATILCQAATALIVTLMLFKSLHIWEIQFSKIHFIPASLKSILRVGIPAGIEAAMYCIANSVIQVFVNNLGTDYVAAWGTFGRIDAFFWMVINAFNISITNFVGQNYGAGNIKRMRKSVRVCLIMNFAAASGMIAVLYIFAEPFYQLFTTDLEVIQLGTYMLRYMMIYYILYVAIGVLSGALRGAGDVLIPVFMTCGGVCVLRIAWMYTVVRKNPGIESIMWSYPVSWGITAVLFVLYYLKKFPREKAVNK